MTSCLFSRLIRRRSKKTLKLRVTGLYVGNSPGPVNSPHKWPVTRKKFPFDDVIMYIAIEQYFSWRVIRCCFSRKNCGRCRNAGVCKFLWRDWAALQHFAHWDRDKIADIFQTTFSNVLSWMKMYELCLRFHRGLFLRFELTIFQYWLR